MDKPSTQSGNVLFLILIAVALFAALSYAVTQSIRGGGNTTKDNGNIVASQIVQYSTLIKTAVDRMKLINGCSDTEISAHADFWGHNKGSVANSKLSRKNPEPS